MQPLHKLAHLVGGKANCNTARVFDGLTHNSKSTCILFAG
jgi:hypothetical protein